MTQKQVAEKYGVPTWWLSRRAKMWASLGAIKPAPGLHGGYDANPEYFTWARAKWKTRVHGVRITLITDLRSRARFTELREKWAKLPHKKGTKHPDKRIVPDESGKITRVWADRCKLDPSKFKPTATTSKIIFYVHGWGSNAKEAEQNAWDTGHILRDMYQNIYGLKLEMVVGDREGYKYLKSKSARLSIDDSPDEGTLHGVGNAGGELLDKVEKAIEQDIPELKQDIPGLKNDLKKIKAEVLEIKKSQPESVSIYEFNTRMKFHEEQFARIESKIDRIEPTLSRLADVLERMLPL
ncbi:MAG: hypothetical protein Q6370_025485 [Candidatus Sigynarchaeota archaeon]